MHFEFSFLHKLFKNILITKISINKTRQKKNNLNFFLTLPRDLKIKNLKLHKVAVFKYVSIKKPDYNKKARE